MATWYVSKAEGADANAGTSTSAPKSTPQAALNSSSAGDTIEFIDSETYYDASGSGHTYYLADAQEKANITIKAGTDSDGNKYKPTLCGKTINESGSIVAAYAVKYNTGWTFEGIEFRDFGNSGLVYSDSGISNLTVKDCSFHHITQRDGHGSAAAADAAILLGIQGDQTTNVIERCYFYEIGAYAVRQTGTTGAMTVRNCLVYSWGGEGGASAGNWSAFLSQNTGSVVEHCTIVNFEGNPNGTTPIINLGSGSLGGMARYNIIHSCVNGTNSSKIYANTAKYNIVFACGGANLDAEITVSDATGNLSQDPLFVNTGSAESTTSEAGTHPDFTFAGTDSPCWQGAVDSTTTDDILNNGNKRDSYSAGNIPAIGCYQFYREFSDYALSDNVLENDYIINTLANISKEYKTIVSKTDTAAPAVAPFSKGVRGPAHLRGRSTAYGCTQSGGDPSNVGKEEE